MNTPGDLPLSQLRDECQTFIESRFPADEDFPGAAAMLLADGTVLIGTAPEVANAGVELCHETEPFCAAYRLGQRIVASICLSRHTDGRHLVFSPCGICRERLAIHGPEVLVGVASPGDPTTPAWKRLKDVHLDYWVTPLMQAEEAAGWLPSA
ncbi:MAG: cytidine deaminase [Corynebacterium sp.]|uniref:cytidine deaminase n=1 Tax=Corynebacterium sp. TaxID=1720 RepID=UPI0026DFE9C5|nr:cytidine deaminase [Corynebacterium sp.]MDO5670927.1 cytidine deaminase [Corynebacterium sp.]